MEGTWSISRVLSGIQKAAVALFPIFIFETVDPFTPEAARARATSGVSFTVVVASGTSLRHIA